ncbi:MAG: hypothetical protein R3B09_09975 [Nannocystaceae bacterium]
MISRYFHHDKMELLSRGAPPYEVVSPSLPGEPVILEIHRELSLLAPRIETFQIRLIPGERCRNIFSADAIIEDASLNNREALELCTVDNVQRVLAEQIGKAGTLQMRQPGNVDLISDFGMLGDTVVEVLSMPTPDVAVGVGARWSSSATHCAGSTHWKMGVDCWLRSMSESEAEIVFSSCGTNRDVEIEDAPPPGSMRGVITTLVAQGVMHLARIGSVPLRFEYTSEFALFDVGFSTARRDTLLYTNRHWGTCSMGSGSF